MSIFSHMYVTKKAHQATYPCCSAYSSKGKFHTSATAAARCFGFLINKMSPVPFGNIVCELSRATRLCDGDEDEKDEVGKDQAGEQTTNFPQKWIFSLLLPHCPSPLVHQLLLLTWYNVRLVQHLLSQLTKIVMPNQDATCSQACQHCKWEAGV